MDIARTLVRVCKANNECLASAVFSRLSGPAICSLAILVVFPAVAAAQTPRPFFDDEFTGSSLDTGRWMVETFAGRNQGNFRAEAVYYKPEAVSVSGHALHIATDRVSTTDTASGVVLPLRSGRIQSRASFLYGRFEFRAKLPKGAGLWPAIWLRTPYGQPFNGEIDVVEGRGSMPNMIQSTLHHWKNGVEPGQDCAWLAVQPMKPGKQFPEGHCGHLDHSIKLPADLSADYHTYTMEWLPGSVTWSIDGQPYYSVSAGVPAARMSIVIDVSFSHNWDGGSPATTELPQSLDVQYVRVYPMAAPVSGPR